MLEVADCECDVGFEDGGYQSSHPPDQTRPENRMVPEVPEVPEVPTVSI